MGVLEESRLGIAPSPAQPWSRLEFDMQQQLQTYWCWAATSVSVSHFYDQSSSWTQCRMVNEERAQTTCCVDGTSNHCDVTNVLDKPLKRAGVFDRMVAEALSFDEIRDEIDAGRPVGWRIEWADERGHFAVIEGYLDGDTRRLAIEDPAFGSLT